MKDKTYDHLVREHTPTPPKGIPIYIKLGIILLVVMLVKFFAMGGW